MFWDSTSSHTHILASSTPLSLVPRNDTWLLLYSMVHEPLTHALAPVRQVPALMLGFGVLVWIVQ